MANIDGTSGNDILNDTSGDDTINGFAGNDLILATHGNDTIDGGDGDDEIFGGDENDVLHGGSGDDILWDGTGTDTVFGDADQDTINAGAGDDTYDGGTGSANGIEFDHVDYREAEAGIVVDLRLATGQVRSEGTADIANVGVDTLVNIEGVTGSAFDDVMTGGAANDTFDGAGGNDTLDGGEGSDWASYQSSNAAVTVSLATTDAQDTGNGLDTLLNIENLRGSNFDDVLTGNDGDNLIDGGTGNDTITDGAGSDHVDAGAGDFDVIYASVGAGSDVYDGGAGTHDIVYYTSALAGVRANLATGTAQSVASGNAAGIGVDQLVNVEDLFGSAFDDVLTGNAGDNGLIGRDGNDILKGGDGNDVLSGGEGDDVLAGGSGIDRITYGSSTVGIHVSLAITTAQDTGQGYDTITGVENVTGTLFNDELTGNSGANFLLGFDGDDRLIGGAGTDTLSGDVGNDYLDGGAGRDLMQGGVGDDTYVVDHPSDHISEFEGEGTDTVLSSIRFGISEGIENLTLTGTANIGGFGNGTANIIIGNGGANTLWGNAGDDDLIGNAGNDTLDGGVGADNMKGGTGDDTYVVDNGGDAIVENVGEGTDTILATLSLTLQDNIENLTLTGTADLNGFGNDLDNVLIGNSGSGELDAGAGNDTIHAHGGNDTLEGWEGNDALYGDSGNDILLGGAGDDIVDGGAGIDTATYVAAAAGVTVNLGRVAAQDTVGDGIDTLAGVENVEGSSFSDHLTGNSVANVLTGNAGNDVLDGGAGNDHLIGGLGDDVYYADSYSDAIVENFNEGTDSVVSSANFQLSGNVEKLALTGAADIYGYGNDIDNVLTGNSGANKLFGLGGSDTINGGAGNDKMYGGSGDDTYYVDASGDAIVEKAGEGTDQVVATANYHLGLNVENLAMTGSSNLSASGNSLDNLVYGNSGANKLYGLDGNDTLKGGLGDDRLEGGAGQDLLYGASGADKFVFANGDFAGLTASTCDRIKDFEAGDHIHLRLVDADTLTAGDQAFDFIGTSAFSHTAGELRYEQISGNTYVSGDTDGDGLADFLILLDGSHALAKGDFVL